MALKVGDYVKLSGRDDTYLWKLVPEWVKTNCPQYTGKIEYWESLPQGSCGTVVHIAPTVTIGNSTIVCLVRLDDGKYYAMCKSGVEKRGKQNGT